MKPPLLVPVLTTLLLTAPPTKAEGIFDLYSGYDPDTTPPFNGITVTPGPGLPSLASRGLTVELIHYALLNATENEFAHHLANPTRHPLARRQSPPTTKKKPPPPVPVIPGRPNCYPSFLADPVPPYDLADYCVAYLSSLSDHARGSRYIPSPEYATCAVLQGWRRRVFCSAVDNKGKVVTILGWGDFDYYQGARCVDVAFAAWNVVRACRERKGEYGDALVAGEDWVTGTDARGREGRLMVAVRRDDPMLEWADWTDTLGGEKGFGVGMRG